MKGFVSSLILVSVIAIQAVAFQSPRAQAAASSGPTVNLTGRWRVKFTFSGNGEKNLIFESKPRGAGSFQLLDTGPDNKPAANLQTAVWSQLTNDRVSFSGEAELPIGTCCREIGTLLFKGKFASSNDISGKFVFVTSVDDEESPYKLRSLVGTFTATRIPR